MSTDPGDEPTREYVVEKLVDDRPDPERGRLFRVRWMGYDPEDDTWEEEAGLPRHFIERYLRGRQYAN